MHGGTEFNSSNLLSADPLGSGRVRTMVSCVRCAPGGPKPEGRPLWGCNTSSAGVSPPVLFSEDLCIECDACVDICPTDCINFVDNAPEKELRNNLRIPALNLDQTLLVSEDLPTKRAMIKDEDVCLHCGLCAERCPTGAWDMQTFLYEEAKVYS